MRHQPVQRACIRQKWTISQAFACLLLSRYAISVNIYTKYSSKIHTIRQCTEKIIKFDRIKNISSWSANYCCDDCTIGHIFIACNLIKCIQYDTSSITWKFSYWRWTLSLLDHTCIHILMKTERFHSNSNYVESTFFYFKKRCTLKMWIQ